MLGPDDDVRVAFRSFWEEERTKANTGLIEREGLDPAAFEALHRDILFSGKRPLADQVVAAMRVKPGILKRKPRSSACCRGSRTWSAPLMRGWVISVITRPEATGSCIGF